MASVLALIALIVGRGSWAFFVHAGMGLHDFSRTRQLSESA